MFTSLRSRLWLSYALVITVALTIVAIVLLAFLIRNPVLTRQTQQQLRTVKNLIVENPEKYLNDPVLLENITTTYGVRILVFNLSREIVFDTNPNDPQIPFPRRNLLNQSAQVALDSNS